MIALLAALSLAAAPTARFVVRLETEKAAAIPATATLRFRPIDKLAQEPATAFCTIADRRVSCPLPPGTFDLELHVDGYAPADFWGVSIGGASSSDAGVVRLLNGSMVEGKVVEKGGGIRGVTIELQPDATLAGNHARRSSLRIRRATSDRAGSFSFADVGPGEYLLVARKEGYATTSRSGIRVEAAVDHLAPVELKSFARLHLMIAPPVDYYGQPWAIVLNRWRPTGYQDAIRSGTASLAGEWSAGNLDPARYRIQIYTSRREQVDARDADVDGEIRQAVHIDAVPVYGTITLDGKPVDAGVAFVWSDGSRIAVQTAADGTFATVLPHEGDWRASVRLAQPRLERLIPSVAVKRAAGAEKAKVDIDLPAGALHGQVVDEAGHGVRAGILLFDGERLDVSSESGDDGAFRIVALTPGARTVSASTKSGSSGLVPVTVSEKDDTSVTLTVQSFITIHGTLTDAAGTPVAGAMVRFATPVSPMDQQTGTGLSGDFLVKVPRNAGTVALLFVAPALPRKWLTQPIDGAAADQTLNLASGPAGRLVVVPTPGKLGFITRDGVVFFPLYKLFLPFSDGPPAELRGRGYTFDVEAGAYTICSEPRLSDRCVTKPVGQGTEVVATEGGEGRWR